MSQLAVIEARIASLTAEINSLSVKQSAAVDARAAAEREARAYGKKIDGLNKDLLTAYRDKANAAAAPPAQAPRPAAPAQPRLSQQRPASAPVAPPQAPAQAPAQAPPPKKRASRAKAPAAPPAQLPPLTPEFAQEADPGDYTDHQFHGGD